MLEKLFKLNDHNTSVRTEVLAGLTTFLTMSYIIFVNPEILSSTGMDRNAVFVATCIAAALGSGGTGCQLADRHGTGDGPQCLLRVHCRGCHGLFLAAGARSCVHLGLHLFATYSNRNTSLARRGHSQIIA